MKVRYFIDYAAIHHPVSQWRFVDFIAFFTEYDFDAMKRGAKDECIAVWRFKSWKK